LNLAWEYTRRERGMSQPRFLSMRGAYHGDTIGAVSLGHIDRFHAAFGGLLFPTDAVMAPYCYRCPFNRAQPERADARSYRRCQWECVGEVERAFAQARREGDPYSALVYEPRIQGAAGMIPQPDGWLRQTAQIARGHGALLIADEVLSGFGRTGGALESEPLLFASHQEKVQPDFLNLAKGLSGGYLPLAATLTTASVFEAFLGEHDDFKAFYHGHSFTGNQLGSAASLASLRLLERPDGIRHRALLEQALTRELAQLWQLPNVGDVRQVGLIAGVELVLDWTTREPFAAGQQLGNRVCEAMRQRGVLTRPIGDVIVLMPPYCTTHRQLRRMVTALAESVAEVLGS
jgi:adenosylmethionine-8-amino-7-oxononanoate aminotransferase